MEELKLAKAIWDILQYLGTALTVIYGTAAVLLGACLILLLALCAYALAVSFKQEIKKKKRKGETK